jgi:hypothetical protein
MARPRSTLPATSRTRDFYRSTAWRTQPPPSSAAIPALGSGKRRGVPDPLRRLPSQHPAYEREIGVSQFRTAAADALDDGGGAGGVSVDGDRQPVLGKPWIIAVGDWPLRRTPSVRQRGLRVRTQRKGRAPDLA